MANNYVYNLFKSMEKNNQLFSQVVAEKVQALTNVSLQGPWQWCFRENRTFLDCPIGQKNGTEGQVNMIVAVYNPSIDPTNYTNIAVPHGHFDVSVLS